MIHTKIIIAVLLAGTALGAGGVYIATNSADTSDKAPAVQNIDTNSPEGATDTTNNPSVEKTDGGVQVNVGAAIVINGMTLNEAQISTLTKLYGKAPVAGNYWYDAKSGFQGTIGQPTAGQIAAGLPLGTLARNASNGDTGVIVNGRELPAVELNFFQQFVGAIPAGSYWLDATGNVGVAGSDTPLVNLAAAAKARGGTTGGGDNFWSTNFSAGNSNADNSQGYVSVDGYGPVGYGF